MSYAGGGGFNPGNNGYSPSQPGAGGYSPSQPGAGGYSPSNPGSGGYAPSSPGNGGFAPNNYNTYNGGPQGPVKESCCNNPGDWCLRNNPWKLANNVGPDILYAARYKQAMALGLASLLVALFGFFFRSNETPGFVNAAAFLHIIPILLPCCKRGATPFWWSFICLSSIALTGVGVLLGAIDGFKAGVAIAAAIIALIELVNLWVLSKMDRELKTKVQNCFVDCGCCGEKKQLQTMVAQESAFVNKNPQMQPQMNRFNGGASQVSAPPPGLDNGSMISGPGTGPRSYAGTAPFNQGPQNNFGGNNNNRTQQNTWARNHNRTIRNALSDTASEPSYTTSPSTNSNQGGNFNQGRNFRNNNTQRTQRRGAEPVQNFQTGNASTFSFLTDMFPKGQQNQDTLGSNGGHYMSPTGAANPPNFSQPAQQQNGGPNGAQLTKRKERHRSRKKLQSDVEFKGMSDEFNLETSSQVSGASEKGSLVFNTHAFDDDEGPRPNSFTV